VAPGLFHAAPRLRGPSGLCGSLGRNDGAADRLLVEPVLEGARVRLSLVLSAVLARRPRAAGAVALAGPEYRPRRGLDDQGRSNQHGALLGSQAAAARSSFGRIHVERGPAAAGGRTAQARQALGAQAHGTETA